MASVYTIDDQISGASSPINPKTNTEGVIFDSVCVFCWIIIDLRLDVPTTSLWILLKFKCNRQEVLNNLITLTFTIQLKWT